MMRKEDFHTAVQNNNSKTLCMSLTGFAEELASDCQCQNLLGHGFPRFDPVAVGAQNRDEICEESRALEKEVSWDWNICKKRVRGASTPRKSKGSCCLSLFCFTEL